MTQSRITNLVAAALLFGLLPVPPNASAAAADVLTLESAVGAALENNRDVRNARLDVEKARLQVAVNRTYRLPSINSYVLGARQLSSVDLKFKKGDLGTVEGFGPLPSEDVTIESPGRFSAMVVNQVTQPLSQLRRIGLGVQQAQIGVQIAEERLRATQQSVTATVKTAYYAILQTQSSLHVAEENIRLYRELDRVAEQYVLQRVALKSESLDVKTRLAQRELDALSLQDTFVSQKENFNALLGRDLQTDFSVAAVLPAEFLLTDLEQAQIKALAQRPEIRQAKLKVAQAEVDRKSKKSEFIPDVTLNFSHTSPINYSDVLPGHVTTLGVAVNWNLFDWGRKKNELAAKEVSIVQAGNSVKDAESLVVREVNANYRKLQRTAQQLRVAELAQETATESLRVAANSYKAEASLYKDVLQSETALDQADSQYQQALLSFWTAKSEFEKSMGEDYE